MIVETSRLKDKFETKTPVDFDYDVMKFNTWFCDTRDLRIRDEGDKYDEYLQLLFRAYQPSEQPEFSTREMENRVNIFIP